MNKKEYIEKKLGRLEIEEYKNPEIFHKLLQVNNTDLGLPNTPISLDEEISNSPIDYGIENTEIYDPNIKPSTEISFKTTASLAKSKELIIEIEKGPSKESEERGELPQRVLNILNKSKSYFIKLHNQEFNFCQSATRTIFSNSTKNKTLILDLDSTLIQAFPAEKYTAFYDSIPQTNIFHIPFIIRPHLYQFLDKVNKYYEVWIYSAGETEYVQDIISVLDPNHIYFKGALTRNNCAMCEIDGVIIPMKNLCVITNRKRENILIIDDAIHVWPNDLGNIIPIKPFKGNPKDNTFKNILKLVVMLYSSTDISRRLQKSIPLISYIKGMLEDACK